MTSSQTYEEETHGHVKMTMLVWLRKLLEEADVDLLREMVLPKVMPLLDPQ